MLHVGVTDVAFMAPEAAALKIKNLTVLIAAADLDESGVQQTSGSFCV